MIIALCNMATKESSSFPNVPSCSALRGCFSWDISFQPTFSLNVVTLLCAVCLLCAPSPLCCCIYFQTLRASPLTLNHMRLCKKKTNISGLLLAGCALKALRNIEISTVLFTDPLTLSSQTFPCVQSSLCVRMKSQNIELTLKLMAKDPHPALVGPFTDFTALMFNFKRRWPLQQAHAWIFHIFSPHLHYSILF